LKIKILHIIYKQFLITIVLITLLCNSIYSQELTVLYGTPMTILGGTSFHVNGLTLLPSSDFTLNNVSLYKNEKVSNYLSQTTVSRVYKFSSTTDAFIGEASINYLPEELASGNFSNLKMDVHNGKAWSVVPLKTNDVRTHNTQSQLFSQSLNEIVLTDNAFTPILTILGNPVINGILVFNINGVAEVGLYDFSGNLLWRNNYKSGTYSVPVSNLKPGSYLLKANELGKIVIIPN